MQEFQNITDIYLCKKVLLSLYVIKKQVPGG